MKNNYLLYLCMLVVLTSACKKNDVIKDSGTDGPTGGTENSKPIVVTDMPRLINLRLNGIACAYDSISHTYFYPATANAQSDTYTVNFDSTAAATVTINESELKSGDKLSYAFKINQLIEVKATNSVHTSVDYTLQISALPIVTINLPTDNIGDDRTTAAFRLIDPDYHTRGGLHQVKSTIFISLRGATARNLPKKSFAVRMIDNSGISKDVSLLGLRDDEDWILDAMYIDQSRMRNRLCTDIWNSFNNVPYIADEPTALNGTRGYMTEVFLNNKYHGIYCLTEKLDRKQLQVKKQYGAMYKAIGWGNEVIFAGTSIYNNDSPTWGGWQFEYPSLGDTPAPNWRPLYVAVDFFSRATTDDFIAGISDRVDINNMVDYFIFNNVINGLDNEAKNTYFSFYDSRTATKFFYTPWDLDATMGRDYDGTKVNNSLLLTYNNHLLQRLVELNAGNFKTLLKARWNSLKNNQLSKETVAERIQGYGKILNSGDAFKRESAVVNNIDQSIETEMNYMINFYEAQYDLFDKYVNGL